MESRADILGTALERSMDTFADLEAALAAIEDDVAANQDQIEALKATIFEVKSEIKANWAEAEKILEEYRQEIDLQIPASDAFKKGCTPHITYCFAGQFGKYKILFFNLVPKDTVFVTYEKA